MTITIRRQRGQLRRQGRLRGRGRLWRLWLTLHTFSHSAIKIIQWNVIPNKHLAPFSPPTRMYMHEHKRMKYQHVVLFYLNHLLLSKLLWKFLFSLWSAWNGDVVLLHRLSEHRQLPCRRVHVVQRDGKWRKFLLQGANTHPSII